MTTTLPQETINHPATWRRLLFVVISGFRSVNKLIQFPTDVRGKSLTPTGKGKLTTHAQFKDEDSVRDSFAICYRC